MDPLVCCLINHGEFPAASPSSCPIESIHVVRASMSVTVDDVDDVDDVENEKRSFTRS